MTKTRLRLVAPITVNRTVTPNKHPRTREHLTVSVSDRSRLRLFLCQHELLRQVAS
jgi:hypothetical protein